MVNDGESEIDEIKYCDEFGNDIRNISYLDDKILQITDAENEYNSDGQVIRIKQSAKSFVEYLHNGDSVVELEYNENGFVKKETIHQDEIVTISEFEYEYDELGRPITVMEYMDGSDELFSQTYKTYDENGNITKEKTGYRIRIIVETFYEYDEKGRVLKVESSAGKSSVCLEYEYEDYKDFTLKRPNGLTY